MVMNVYVKEGKRGRWSHGVMEMGRGRWSHGDEDGEGERERDLENGECI